MIRGNLIVIPIGDSFVYVEPVYLMAKGTDIPQLKRVIVIAGNKVVMEPTLAEAINAVLGKGRPDPPYSLNLLGQRKHKLPVEEHKDL